MIAVGPDRAIYVHDPNFVAPDPPLVSRSLIARLDPTLSEWTTTILDSDIESPVDIEFKRDGNVIVAGEFDVFDIDLAAESVQLSGFRRTGSFDNTIGVEINLSGTVTVGSRGQGDPTALFRQAPDAGFAERFETGIRLADFILDSDGSSVIGTQAFSGSLYRLNVDTKAIDLLFESDLLAETRRIEIDPNGRIVALTRPSALLHRLVRVDLSHGTTDIVAEFEGRELGDMDLLLPPEGSLQAGDADQDLDFDQFDLVKVQVAAKYLTGRSATWGEGDWDGAPGGIVGAPPPGDGVFNQLDIITALTADRYLRGPYAALSPRTGARDDGQTSIVYDPTSGEVSVDAPSGTQLTSIKIDSASGIFTGTAAQNLGGSFDNNADNNIFKATFGSSFGSLSFGNVAQPGLSASFVLNDLSVVGSLAGGGDLGNVDLIYVPEPTTFALAVVLAASLPIVWRIAPRKWTRCL